MHKHYENKKNRIMSARKFILYGGTLIAVVIVSILLATLPLKPVEPSVTTRPIEQSGAARGENATAATVAQASAQNPDIRPGTAMSGVRIVQNASRSPRQQQFRQTVAAEQPYRILAVSNDPLTASDWKLDTVNTTEAWTYTPVRQAVVAVIDSGFALDHEDLMNKWHTNSGEQGMTQIGDACWSGASAQRSTNNCDDDANGYVDDWRGWDFYAVDNIPMTGTENPAGEGTSHGTEVAGLVGAETNNGKGVASVGIHSMIMPLQVTNDDGVGYTSDIMAAIFYAVDNGADVINISLGGPSQDIYLKQAVEYAYNNDVLVVAASGNCAGSSDPFCAGTPAGGMTYPALYPTVMAVGATTQSNQRASFSGYGPWLDIVAPGSGTIRSTSWTSSNQTSAYAGSLYGTSFSSPIVASIAGAVISVKPDISVRALESILLGGTTGIVGMNGQVYSEFLGHGMANAGTSVRLATILSSLAEAPTLHLSGTVSAEHFYNSGSTIASGCSATPGTWCTVRLKSQAGHTRYLPYRQLNDSGMTQWSFGSDAMLANLVWDAAAYSGGTASAGYVLLTK